MDKFLVNQVPARVYYIPEFVSREEEEHLLAKIYSAPKPKWTQLSGRRLQNWGGLPHPKGMVQESLPQWLKNMTDKVTELGFFDGKPANHVLVNEYEAGQGIMPHLDGPLFYPTITTVSLGSHTVLDFYKPMEESKQESSLENSETKVNSSFDSRHMQSIVLQPRSLVVFKEDMYNCYLHGIKETKTDTITENIVNPDENYRCKIGDVLERKTRISLTIRHVPKVLKVKLGIRK